MLKIDCEQDFSALAEAFEGEYSADCNLACEVIIVDEDYIRRLNADIRKIDKVTDVLSFPSLDGIKGIALNKKNYPDEIDEEGNLFIGSIAVCEKRAREQAEEYGHSFVRELNYLVTHGVFHLLGYDHMTEEDKSEMREREERVLRKLNLSRD